MTTEQKERLQRTVAYMQGQPCICCHRPGEGVGLFMPYDSEDWGGRPGKQRCLVYSLCHRCHRDYPLDVIEGFIRGN